MSAPRRRAERGQAIVLIALMMAVLVGFVALAIDSARAFDSRRIMQDAVDSAALAAAEYYQDNPGAWTTAEARATFYFQLDNRVLGGTACSPGSVSPTPGAPGTALSMTCTFGSSNYQLKITAEDDGPGGQSFTALGQNTLDLALMQVLGQSSTITVKATATATASNQARTPALTALSSAGCSWAASASPPLSVSTFSTLLSVLGDVVSGGTFNVSSSSNASVAGDVDTRCGLVGFPTHMTTRCWPSGAATPCTSPDVVGTQRSAAFHPIDPGFPAPPSQSSPASPPAAFQVALPPGLYSSNPFTTSNGCYFLEGGIFEFSNTFSVASGLVSNELRPPSAPVYGSTTSISPDQFWNDYDHGGSAPQNLHCDGDFSPTPVPAGGRTALAAGSYSVELTSVRSDTVNGTAYVRESVPSACKTVSVAASEVAQLTISNVPGATSYNVYSASNGTCTGPLNLVSGPLTSVTGTPSNNNLAGCPDTTSTPNCSLGQVTAVYDGSATVNAAIHPPDPTYKPFATNYPGQPPLRAGPPSGDLANENYCGSGGTATACPTTTNAGASRSLVTPGAVEISLTGNSCLSVSGGDAFLFSGYQYDWIVNYEPVGSTCTSTWQGRYNSALVGLSYTPGASFHFVGNAGSQTACFGGVMASTVVVLTATTLALDYSGLCAPRPWGTRLTG